MNDSDLSAPDPRAPELVLDIPCSVALDGPPVSRRVMDIATMFGVSIDDSSTRCLHDAVRITLPLSGGAVYVTGPSGGGKSTLLRGIERACRARGIGVINFDDLPLDSETALVDGFDGSLEDACAALALAGLGEARAMIARPCELSAGQYARWAFAQALAWARIAPRPTVILADEFASSLDRITASVLARSARRLARDLGVVFIAATAHDDLLDALEPAVLVHVDLGGVIEVARR